MHAWHLHSDPGFGEWKGCRDFLTYVGEGVRGGNEAGGRCFSTSTHSTTHCTQQMSHLDHTLPWLWSQGRASVPIAAHSKALVHNALSLHSQTHSITSLKRECSQAPRPLGMKERENKNEVRTDQKRAGVRNRHSNKLLFLLEVTLCDIK